MKILFSSDTHGKTPPYPSEDTDLVLHGGDFYNRLRPGRMVKEDNDLNGLFEYRDALRETGKPFYAVRGNHDINDPAGFFGDADVTGNVVEVASGLFLVGLGWHGERFYELPPPQLLSNSCAKLLEECVRVMKDGDHSIFISHYCASGRIEESPGWVFDCVRDVALAIRPLIVLQGHCHDLFGRQWEYDGIRFLVPGPKGIIVNLDDEFNVRFELP